MGTVRLYHPALGREIEVPDDEACIAVHAESGWERAPEPTPRPGYEPDPVTYAPVTQERKAGKAGKE